MIPAIWNKALHSAPSVIAMETAVVDWQYPAQGGLDGLKRQFFANLSDMIVAGGGTPLFAANPRGGDMRLVFAEDFDNALVAFAGHHPGIFGDGPDDMPVRDAAQYVRDVMFGLPHASAGGSLANSFDALVHARVNGQPVLRGVFATAAGLGTSGDVFAASLEGSSAIARGGRQLECHVFPIDGDRIMLTTPSKTEPAEALITAALFGPGMVEKADRIMLGGFLFYTPHFHAIYDDILGRIEALEPAKRPTLVLTAAAQGIAEQSAYRATVTRAIHTADTIIHANTGEFRRLMDMDTQWRLPYEPDFEGLTGQVLEKAKKENAAYQAAKAQANQIALSAAHIQALTIRQDTGHDLRYVVTDGPRSIYVVNAHGCETYAPHPVPRSAIVSTVGAGDNFAAGFQFGDLFDMPHAVSASLGSDFAGAIIQSSAARLAATHTQEMGGDLRGVTLGGALAHISPATLQNHADAQKALTPGFRPARLTRG